MRSLGGVGSLLEEASAFLAGPGCKVVRARLISYHLPASLFDDLVQEVLMRALLAERRGDVPVNVDAFVSTLVFRAARDMLRGHLRRPEGHLAKAMPEDAGDHHSDPLEDVAAVDHPEDDVITADELARLGAIVDDIRRRLTISLDRNPPRAAGALAVLAVVHGDALPARDCPTPTRGVAQSESVNWAGLFYGGAERCFPTDDDPEDPAMRKRRSRALRHQAGALRAAAAELATRLEADGA